MKLFMSRTVPLTIINSFSLHTQQWYISYRFVDSFRAGSGWNCSSFLILLESCQQICTIYSIAVCTVKNSWWWTEELSKTCRVSFQNKLDKLAHLAGFIIRKREFTSWPILKGLLDYRYKSVLALVILGLFNDVFICLCVTFRVTIREKALMG
jgi:hypothetical protein